VELRNVSIKIPLLQEIKYAPTYVKFIKDICTKRPSRKPKDPQTIHAVGKLAYVMLERVLMDEKNDHGNKI